MKKTGWAGLIVIYILICSHTFFELSLGDSACYDEGISIVSVDEDNWLVSAAYNCSGVQGDWKSSLVRLNADGDTLQMLKDLSFNGIMKRMPNGDLIFGGGNSAGFTYDTAVIYQTSVAGELLWEKNLFPDRCNHSITDIFPVENGIIVSGIYSQNGCSGLLYDSYIIYINSKGAIEWEYKIEGSGNDQIHKVKAFNEDFIAAFGWSDSYSHSHDVDYLLIKLNSGGSQIFKKTYGDEANNYGYGMDVLDDGSFIICGYSSDMEAIRLNSDGEVLWQKEFFKSCGGRYFRVEALADGFVFLGKERDSMQQCRSTLLKTNHDGEILWSKSFEGTLRNFSSTGENEFVVVGYHSYPSQIFIAGFDTLKSHSVDTPDVSTAVFSKIPTSAPRAFPNPAYNEITFEMNNRDSHFFDVAVFDASGRVVWEEKNVSTDKVVVHCQQLGKGIYTYMIKGKMKTFTGKFVKI